MTRYIDVDICIEKIKNLSIEYDAETVQRCIEAVSNAPTIDAVPQWIPCRERLPEYDEEVLCQDVGGNMMVLFRSERTNEWTDGLFYSEPLDVIVAWRELPKPYREF